MRKTIRIGVVLLVLGLILTMFGIANNGIQSIYWEQGFHIVRHRSRSYHVSQLKEITLDTSSNIIIKQGTSTKITVTAARTFPKIKTSHGHLTLTSTADDSHSVGFMFGNAGQYTDTTTITVPKGTTVEKVTAESDQTGNLSLQNVTVDQLNVFNDDADVNLSNVKINQSMALSGGNIRLSRVSAPSLQIAGDPDVSVTNSHFTTAASKITTDEGDIHLTNNRFKALRMTTSDGDILFNNNRITDNLSASTSDGDIRGTAPRTTGIHANTSDGDLNIFGHHANDNGVYQVNPSAASQYRLSTNDGDITVTSSN